MKTNQEHFANKQTNESGNALVYVLIAIALFAALSFTLGRQTDTSEAGQISDDQAELYASQLISYAVQAKSSIDQMILTGTDIADLDFILPNASGFNTPPNIYKVFHPEGGGLTPGRIPEDAIAQSTSDPAPGWYIGRFNTVEWTKTTDTDVILVAYQVAEKVCEKINLKVTGSTTIPVMGASIKATMIDTAFHSVSNAPLTTDPDGSPVCAACHNVSTLCVENQAEDAYGFYTILADR